jgi:DNA-binding MarR family transcriptional regulator
MALSQKRTTTQSVLNRPAENQSVPTLTPQQRRILRLLLPGDLIWEIADDPGHRTVYDEKRGCDQRLSTAMVTALEQQGWIRQRPNTQADRLDSWELTPLGRALAPVAQRHPVGKGTPALHGTRASPQAKGPSQGVNH